MLLKFCLLLRYYLICVCVSVNILINAESHLEKCLESLSLLDSGPIGYGLDANTNTI